MADLADTIEELGASKFKKASGDSGSMETHSLADLIAADKYLKSKDASANPFLAVKRTKALPPGAIE